MSSIYKQALGELFYKLHPRIQERFGFNSQSGIAFVGEGTMQSISFAKWAALPLALGASRHIMFPQGGTNIPFTIENYAYRDAFGREIITWNRTFRFGNRLRKFDATMIYSEDRQCIVDYLGTKQHLAVDLDLSVSENGGLCIRSDAQRFYEGWLQFAIPPIFTGVAEVCEWYDEASDHYQISVEVVHPVFGKVFVYRGSFHVLIQSVGDAQVPLHVKPLRTELRE